MKNTLIALLLALFLGGCTSMPSSNSLPSTYYLSNDGKTLLWLHGNGQPSPDHLANFEWTQITNFDDRIQKMASPEVAKCHVSSQTQGLGWYVACGNRFNSFQPDAMNAVIIAKVYAEQERAFDALKEATGREHCTKENGCIKD